MPEDFEFYLNVEGPDAPPPMPLPLGEITIGRHPGSDLCLTHKLVSRNHARLDRSEEGCLLTDLGSANKTFVNEKKLDPNLATPVQPGDTIKIGPYTLRLELVPVEKLEPEEIKAPSESQVPRAMVPEVEEAKEAVLDGGQIDKPPPSQPASPVSPPDFESPVPLGLTIESQRLINYLPGIYQTDFMRRFLGIFESIQVPIEWIIDNFDLYLDPATAPVDFLPWLANWFQFTWGTDWTPQQRRLFLQEAYQIYARRGTRWALSRVLEIYTGVVPEIEDSAEDLAPYTFLVRIPGSRKKFNRAQIEALIDANKPAYTTYVLEGL